MVAAEGKMIATLLGIALVLAQDSPGTKTFSSSELGMSFEHPATWTVVQRRAGPVFTVPIAGVPGGARVEVFAARFRDTKENWFRNERLINEQLGRSVDRQWEETILGVPLLMSLLRWEVLGSPTTTLVGLLYTRSADKLNFRLTAPSNAFEDAETSWRSVLESLRPLTGQLPLPEDPTATLPEPSPTLIATPQPGRHQIRLEAEQRPDRVVLGPVTVESVAAARSVLLRLPSGWTAEASEGSWRVATPGLRGQIRLDTFSTIDSPTPERAIIRLGAATLGEFTSVVKREEPPARFAPSGSRVWTLLRSGPKPGGELVILHAIGSLQPFYWALTYRADGMVAYRADMRLLRGLIDVLRVEPKPGAANP